MGWCVFGWLVCAIALRHGWCESCGIMGNVVNQGWGKRVSNSMRDSFCVIVVLSHFLPISIYIYPICKTVLFDICFVFLYLCSIYGSIINVKRLMCIVYTMPFTFLPTRSLYYPLYTEISIILYSATIERFWYEIFGSGAAACGTTITIQHHNTRTARHGKSTSCFCQCIVWWIIQIVFARQAKHREYTLMNTNMYVYIDKP